MANQRKKRPTNTCDKDGSTNPNQRPGTAATTERTNEKRRNERRYADSKGDDYAKSDLENDCQHGHCDWRLTFELSWDRRYDARPARLMINSTASRAWRHAVGPQLERGVRRHLGHGALEGMGRLSPRQDRRLRPRGIEGELCRTKLEIGADQIAGEVRDNLARAIEYMQ